MSEFKSCILCKKIFNGYGLSTCPECTRKMDEAFVIIRDYLEDHKGANVKDIVETTGLSGKIVSQLLKDERLLPYTGHTQRCKVCNEPITKGKMCVACERKMNTYIQKNGKPENLKKTPNSSVFEKDKQEKAYAKEHRKSREIRLFGEK